MSIFKNAAGHYQSTLLAGYGEVRHAFGTASAPVTEDYLVLQQVHSARVLTARECGPGVEGDALITAEPGVMVAVKTADCVPLLLFDPRSGAVAAVHSGWRGTVRNIAAEAVRAMGREYASRPEDLVAALGPAIGGCCFEVGAEVAVEFGGLFPEREDLDRRTRVDLVEGVVRQLAGAGVERIDRGAPCTFCGGAEFYSWRRDRVKGQRMYAVIGRGV